MRQKLHKGLQIGFLVGFIGRPLGVWADPIPADTSVTKWVEINNELTANLSAYTQTIASRWNGQRYANAHFGADIYPADNGASGKMGNDTYYNTSVVPWIDAMAALGITSMKVTVSFPVLYAPYYTYIAGSSTLGAAQYNATLANYLKLAQYVKSKGMKLVVDSMSAFPSDPNVASFYSTLSMSAYQAGRSQVINTLAENLSPDYLILQTEPQTEVDNILAIDPLKTLNNPSTDAAMIQQFMTNLDADTNVTGLHSSILVGSGMGTWQVNFEDGTPATPGFKNAIVNLPRLDFLDIHVYPIYTVGGSNFLDRIAEMASLAHNKGLKAGMSEAWAYKEQASEAGRGTTSTEIYSRDIYSFWSTLDSQFLEAMVHVAHWQQLDYMSPFFDKYFLAYTDYHNTPAPCGPLTSQNFPDVMCQGVGPATPNANDLVTIATHAAGAVLSHPPISYTATALAYQILINPVTANLSVIIQSPQAAQVVAGLVPVNSTVTAFATTGIARTELSIDNVLQSSLTAAPYNFLWDSTKVTDGAHNVSVTTYDRANNTSGASVTVTVNNSGAALPPPTLNLPAVIPANAQISCGYPDGYNITLFDWSIVPANQTSATARTGIPGAASGSFTTPKNTASLSTINLIPGTYQIRVTAQDSNGRISPAASATVTLASVDLSGVRVYPNPWRSDRHGRSPITFDFLTIGSTIKIFNISGHLIKTLTPTSDKIQWDLSNESGDKAASGLYFYLISDTQGGKVHGSLAVIR